MFFVGTSRLDNRFRSPYGKGVADRDPSNPGRSRDPLRASVLLEKTLFTLACLVLPVLWGVLVNWMFGIWQTRKSNTDHNDDQIFPDFQI